MLFVTPSWLEDPMAMLDEERGTYRETSKFPETGSGYQEIQSTRPQTLVYGLTDSPAGLAGWITEKFRAWSGDDVDATIVRD